MGFHRRFITDEHVTALIKNNKIKELVELYTKGADVIITDAGISSKILQEITSKDTAEETIIRMFKSEFNLENMT